MGRLGIAFSGGADPAEIVDCIKLAETLGFESACTTSVFVRTVQTIAMAAATVDATSAGRFILGVGSSHKVQVGPEHGVPYGKPLTRVRESVAVIRALLRDGRVSNRGETVHIEGFGLG